MNPFYIFLIAIGGVIVYLSEKEQRQARAEQAANLANRFKGPLYKDIENGQVVYFKIVDGRRYYFPEKEVNIMDAVYWGEATVVSDPTAIKIPPQIPVVPVPVEAPTVLPPETAPAPQIEPITPPVPVGAEMFFELKSTDEDIRKTLMDYVMLIRGEYRGPFTPRNVTARWDFVKTYIVEDLIKGYSYNTPGKEVLMYINANKEPSEVLYELDQRSRYWKYEASQKAGLTTDEERENNFNYMLTDAMASAYGDYLSDKVSISQGLEPRYLYNRRSILAGNY